MILCEQRFLMHKMKQRFRAKFIHDAVRKMEERAQGRNFVVAYGDGSFPVTMKGTIGGGGCHRSLMILLSKRVRVVMTDEHQTTHACPYCREEGMNKKMIHPKGNDLWFDRNLGRFRRKEIHGLSHCRVCKKLWSRDYAATLNIARSFVNYFHIKDVLTTLSDRTFYYYSTVQRIIRFV